MQRTYYDREFCYRYDYPCNCYGLVILLNPKPLYHCVLFFIGFLWLNSITFSINVSTWVFVLSSIIGFIFRGDIFIRIILFISPFFTLFVVFWRNGISIKNDSVSVTWLFRIFSAAFCITEHVGTCAFTFSNVAGVVFSCGIFIRIILFILPFCIFFAVFWRNEIRLLMI